MSVPRKKARNRSRVYDDKGANRLEDYVRRSRPQISNGSCHVCLNGLRFLERSIRYGSGLCGKIVAAYPTIADASFISVSSVSKALDQLSRMGLIELQVGEAMLVGKRATEVRRRSMDELKSGNYEVHLHDWRPDASKELVELLKCRTFSYGEEENCSPDYNISMTGRVMTKCPNVQVDKEVQRWKRLMAGMPSEYRYLIEVDIAQAEPSVAFNMLNRSNYLTQRVPEDMYQWLSSLSGVSRPEAKLLFMQFMYANNSVKSLKSMNMSASKNGVLFHVAEAFDRFKSDLWSKGNPRGQLKRHVRTLADTLIQARKSKVSHRGSLLSWFCQGTVADIINGACLKIIAEEKANGFRFIFPEHDGFYVFSKDAQRDTLAQYVEEEAAIMGLDLEVKTKYETK